MKKIFYILVAAIAFVRCDVMDTTDQGVYSADVVWNDESLATSFIYDAYFYTVMNFVCAVNENITAYAVAARPGVLSDAASDNIIGLNANNAVYKGTYTVNSDAGWDRFSEIRKANIIIQEAANSTELSESVKTNFVAHGRFLRGLLYLRHARLFGGAILIDKPLDTGDELLMARNTIEDTYNFVIDDFVAAAENITSTTCEMGDSFTAYGFAVEAALQAASYVDNGNKQDYYYNLAYELSQKCLGEAGQYSLDPSYDDMFNVFGSPDSHPELSFARVLSAEKYTCPSTNSYAICPSLRTNLTDYNSVMPLGGLPESAISGQATASLSQDMYDCYEVVDEDGVAKRWDETSYYDNYMQNGGYVSQVTMKNRDKRFYASIYLDSTIFGSTSHSYTQLLYTREGGNAHRLNKTYSQGMQMGLYCIAKATHRNYWVSYSLNVDFHQVIFRLGRAYLNHAEVALRLGKETEAKSYINQVRTTHGGLPELDSSLTGEDLWDAYCHERRVDLFFECEDRYWSLLRWAKLGDQDALDALAITHTTMNETNIDGMTWDVIDVPSAICNYPEHIWEDKRFAFPIPQSQIDLSGGVIKQNPGWDLGVTEFY